MSLTQLGHADRAAENPERATAILATDNWLDDGLRALESFGPVLSNGLTNHAPMVIEAMSAMGHGDCIEAWIGAYRSQMRPWPPFEQPNDLADWRANLGQPLLVSAWRSYFLEQLAATPWRSVVQLWVPRLAPGAVSAALHGLIRVGHAVRSLCQCESEPRLHELAGALATWAASYQELTTKRGANGTLTPAEALARIDLVPEHERRNGGAITTALTALEGLPNFAAAIDLPALDGDLKSVNHTFGELFAEVFLANAHTPLTAIVFTHGITGFAAIEPLLPLLSRADGATLVRYVWQASAGLYSCYGEAQPWSVPKGRPAPIAVSRLTEDAIEHGDDHVIKLTEACVRLVSQGSPEHLLDAPRRAMELLPRHDA